LNWPLLAVCTAFTGSERPKVFILGTSNAIPSSLVSIPIRSKVLHSSAPTRNSNAGHEFNDGPRGNGVIGRELCEEERMQILDYLKTR